MLNTRTSLNKYKKIFFFLAILLLAVTITVIGQVQFKFPIYITCSGTAMAGKADTMYFGIGPNNTYGPDVALTGNFKESQATPPPPVFFIWSTWQQIPGRTDPPPEGISASGLKPSDFRGWTSFSQIDTFLLNVKIGPAPAASGAITFTIPPNLRLFASRYEMLKSDADGIYQPFDPDISYPVGRTTVVDSNKAKSKDLWYLIIKYGAYSPETSTSVLISNGWNLVSVPRTQIDYTADNIFPSKFGSMFGYCSPSYCEEPILELGKGYWLFSNQTSNTFVGGTPTDSITINAYYGWNLIGSRETIVNISSLSLNNGAAIFGDAFRFDCVSGSYQPTPVINPGEAVWIYVTADCVITIP